MRKATNYGVKLTRRGLFLSFLFCVVPFWNHSENRSAEARENCVAVASDSKPSERRQEIAVVPKNCVKRAVLVGVNDFEAASELSFAGADVELMRKTLIERLGFKPENIIALTTERGARDEVYAPTKRNIERELKRALEASGPDDMLFLMFSVHGVEAECFDGCAPYVGFVPADAIFDDETGVDFNTTFSLSRLYKELEKRNIRFKWVFVDACREKIRRVYARGSDELKRRSTFDVKGVAVLTGCSSGKLSYETSELGHGVFTYSFTQSLGEVGDANKDGVVTLLEAFERTRENVRKRTAGPGFRDRQEPCCWGSFTDFPLMEVQTSSAKERRQGAETREGDSSLKGSGESLETPTFPTKR